MGVALFKLFLWHYWLIFGIDHKILKLKLRFLETIVKRLKMVKKTTLISCEAADTERWSGLYLGSWSLFGFNTY